MRTRVINTFCVRFAIAVLLVAPIRTAGAASLPKKITSSDGAPMVLVPAGKFIMGSNSGDDSEEPRRKVYIDGFYIDKYELTNARFRAAGMRTKENYGPKFNGSKQPVAGVTWFQARDYCAKVGKRLPSEAEWEKAARGTDGRKSPGATHGSRTRSSGEKTAEESPTPWAGAITPTRAPTAPWTWRGTSGNGAQDVYSPHYYIDAPTRNPKGPSSGDMRIFRGGAWSYTFATDFRAAKRGRSIPETRVSSRGFRCAKDLN